MSNKEQSRKVETSKWKVYNTEFQKDFLKICFGKYSMHHWLTSWHGTILKNNCWTNRKQRGPDLNKYVEVFEVGLDSDWGNLKKLRLHHKDNNTVSMSYTLEKKRFWFWNVLFIFVLPSITWEHSYLFWGLIVCACPQSIK